MQFGGSEAFAASREQVWSFLIDPTRLSPCSPAPIKRVDDQHFRAQARLGSGLFSATIVVDLELSDVRPLEGLQIVGRGGASGTMVDAVSTFSLRDGPTDAPAAATTVMDWDLELTLTGMFAAAGLKVIAEQAPRAIERLMGCVRGLIETRAA